jgi:5'-nucleotidase
VKFDLSSLAMTDPSDLRDASVTVKLGATDLGSFPVTVTLAPPADGNSNDEAGTASVDVVLPATTPAGTATLVVSGPTTGTSALVPVSVTAVSPPPPPPTGQVVTTVGGAATPFRYGDAGTLNIVISRSNATGQVDVFSDTGAKIGTATITAGKGALTLAPKLLGPGVHELTLKYLGTSVFAPSQATVDVRVLKAKPKVSVKVDDTVSKLGGDEVVVRVTAPDDIKVRGLVKLVIKDTGKSVTVKLVKGKAVIVLPKIGKVGTFTLKAKYLGSSLLAKAGKNVKVDVTA